MPGIGIFGMLSSVNQNFCEKTQGRKGWKMEATETTEITETASNESLCDLGDLGGYII